MMNTKAPPLRIGAALAVDVAVDMVPWDHNREFALAVAWAMVVVWEEALAVVVAWVSATVVVWEAVAVLGLASTAQATIDDMPPI